MDRSEIKSKKEENLIGSSVLAFILVGALIVIIFQLFQAFNNEPIVGWYFYFNIIGYTWGLFFVSMLLFFTIKNLIE